MSMWLDNLKFYYGDWTTENNLTFDVNFDDLFTNFDSGRWLNFGTRGDDIKTIDKDFSLTFGSRGDDILIVEGNHNIISGGADADMTVAIGDYNFVSGGTGSDLLGAFGHGNILSPGFGNDFVVVGGTDNIMIASPGNDLFDLRGDPTASAVFSGKSGQYAFEETSLGVYTSTDLRNFFGFHFDGHDTFITDVGVDAGLQVRFIDGTHVDVRTLVPNNIPRTVDDTHAQDVAPVAKTDYNPDGTINRVDAGTQDSAQTATANDRDFDGNVLEATKITEESTGNSSGTTAEGDLAKVAINPDGTYEVTAKSALFALSEGQQATEKYTYQVSDGNGGFNEATITLEFTGKNSDPFAKNDIGSVNENDSVNMFPIANDTDPNTGDTLTLHAIGDIHIDGLLVNDADLYSVLGDTFTFNALGAYFDHLNVGDSSLVAVNYQVADNYGATNDGVMNITINGINDAPVSADTLAGGTEDALPSVDALAAGSDVDDGAVLSFGGFTGGDLGHVSEAGGIISVVGDFQNLDDGESANVIATYFTVDEHGAASNEATATLMVDGLNDAPNLVAGSSITDQSVTEGDSFVLNLTLGDLFEDVDVEPLTVSHSGLPAWLAFNQDAGFDTLLGTADDVLGFSGTPAIGDSGGTISLIASDGDASSDAISFGLTVNPADSGGNGDVGGGDSEPVETGGSDGEVGDGNPGEVDGGAVIDDPSDGAAEASSGGSVLDESQIGDALSEPSATAASTDTLSATITTESSYTADSSSLATTTEEGMINM